MGVNDLWRIIESSCDTISIYQLQGKTIAIDLSCWVVEGQQLVSANAVQPKMYLRNLFFRTYALLMQGTIPVFVLEGKAPELKNKVIAERLAREGKTRGPEKKEGTFNRRRLHGILRDCEKMLKYMGLTCVKAEGEAEAMCAYLNADGLVDGCLTRDGDCFLYGARKIYKKFILTGTTGCGRSVEEYSIEKIEKMYKLGRQKMIALALLCGCDYTSGVTGVGKVSALKFLNSFEDGDILRRMKSWRKDRSKAPTKEEDAVKSKCLLVDNFPNQEVIDEFMMRKGTVPTKIESWRYPNAAKLTAYLADSLAWEIDASFEKVLPLATRWQVMNFKTIPRELRPDILNKMIPIEIKKKKKPQTIPSYEISWEIPKNEEYCDLLSPEDSEMILKEYLTVEPQADVRETYPQLVEKYEELKSKKKTTSRRPKRVKEKEINNEKVETPVKPKKTRAKKIQEKLPSKKIIDYYKQKKFPTNEINKESKKNDNLIDNNYLNLEKEIVNKIPILKTPSKLDDTLKNIYDDLSPEDFARDVDVDSPEMSMIIQKTCSRTKSLISDLLPIQNKYPIDSSEKIYTSGPINILPEEPEIRDISSDDDIVYVPIYDRIKSKS